MIFFTASRAGELGNKSINAWPSSNDCPNLGSRGIEPTKQEQNTAADKNIYFTLFYFSIDKNTQLHTLSCYNTP